MDTMSIVKKMFWPAVVVLLGIVGVLSGFVWILPMAIGVALAMAIWVLSKDREDKPILIGLSQTFFCSALVIGAIGFLSVYLTL